MLSALRGSRNDIEFYIPWDIVDVQCVDWDKIQDSHARRRQVEWTVASSRENEILQEPIKNLQIAGESRSHKTAPA